MIGRRVLLLAAAAAGLVRPADARPGMPAVPYGPRLAFDVIREGSKIGTHVLTFTQVDDRLDIAIAVDIAVSFGPITLFRYTLNGVEEWRHGEVAYVAAQTNDDGTHDFMRAHRKPRGLWVEGSKTAPYFAPRDALPATHWNMAELDSPWINPQDGRLFHPIVRRAGWSPVKLADDRTRTADEFVVSGDVHLDIWYDAMRRWSALTFKAKDGSLVRYELA